MPPRYAYWTILAGGLPTAFRAAEREDLLPTFKRIQEKHPDAQMKYFARGRIWDSPEAARAAKEQQPRGREWRPGGEHRDPRQPFKDAKKTRNQERRQQRFDRKNRPDWRSKDRTPRERPHGDPLGRPVRARPFGRHQGSQEPGPARPDREPRREREPRPERAPREREPRPGPEPRRSDSTRPPSAPPERGRPFKPRPRFQSSKARGPKRRS